MCISIQGHASEMKPPTEPDGLSTLRIDDVTVSQILPTYLQSVLSTVFPNISEAELTAFVRTPREELSVAAIRKVENRGPRLQYAYLLLARERFGQALTAIGDDGISPELVLERARVYEALGYAELALADAYVAYTLLLVVLEGDADSDLVPVGINGERWVSDEDEDEEFNGEEDEDKAENNSSTPKQEQQIPGSREIKKLICLSLELLYRSALLLGCESQANAWLDALVTMNLEVPYRNDEKIQESGDEVDDETSRRNFVQKRVLGHYWVVSEQERNEGENALRERLKRVETNTETSPLFGWSQRSIYPWNKHEPERMGKEALEEINTQLVIAAPSLEVRTSILPALVPEHNENNDTSDSRETNAETWAQLGLYAKQDLAPGSTILEERSMLTAIRPHGEALCDACAADMEQIPAEMRRYCKGCNIPFCSRVCHTAATTRYHAQNEQDEENEEGYPPDDTPFCPGTAGIDDLHVLARAESSTTPEWDLYFLLLSRTLQMAETQGVHPLDLFEIKYLWGDFSSSSGPGDFEKTRPKTLPYSVRHHVELPLQWFEVLMHSRSICRPYSTSWMEKYDWWVIQTLFAKFRGVADAQQSTWTGKPEVAAVHPLWCLANHSCDPNVTWKPSGVRNLTVVKERVLSMKDKWNGIKKGDQIWNHYTDIHEADLRERRGRLRAVLGGECRCERCMLQAKDEHSVNGLNMENRSVNPVADGG